MTDIKPGDIYEDCGYHPVKCTEIDGDILTGVSLIDGQERCCNVSHCGVRKITSEESKEIIILFRSDGERGLLRRAGWTDQAIDDFFAKWR